MKHLRNVMLTSFLLAGLAFALGDQSATPDIVPAYKVETKPQIVKQVPPVYPSIAQKAGVQGTVIVSAVISEEGKIINAFIMKSVPMLDEAALEAVNKWEFSPGKTAGKAVKVSMIIPVQFKLN